MARGHQRPNRLTALLVCALLTIAPAASIAGQTRRVRSAQEILIQLERDWDGAFARRDVALIDTLLADEFIATYSDGSRGDRKKELELVGTFNQQVDSRRQDDFIVKVYGNTAIVWFTHEMKGPSQGRQITVRYQYVDVWVLRDGRWQCVSSQSTKMTPSA